MGLKFHDLRKTFCSLLAQNGVSTAVTQRLLEHSSPILTNKVYTNVDPILRQAVENTFLELVMKNELKMILVFLTRRLDSRVIPGTRITEELF